METVFIEAGQSKTGGNWGKFMVGRFTPEEWFRESVVLGEVDFGTLGVRKRSLLRTCGWTMDHFLVVDLETGKGALFNPTAGVARIDLDKRRVWVCPMFEPFLTWLYTQDLSNLSKLPNRILLPDAEFQFSGYRRAEREG